MVVGLKSGKVLLQGQASVFSAEEPDDDNDRSRSINAAYERKADHFDEQSNMENKVWKGVGGIFRL
jgi:hypothetical protein